MPDEEPAGNTELMRERNGIACCHLVFVDVGILVGAESSHRRCRGSMTWSGCGCLNRAVEQSVGATFCRARELQA